MKKLFVSLILATTTSSILAQQLPIKPARTISFTTTEGSYMDVDLSPDGTTIAFTLLGGIYLLPAQGGTAVQITRGLAYNRHPVFSPDGKQIALISDVSGSKHINVMNADGSSLRTLGAKDPGMHDSGEDDAPVWTPDGLYIAGQGRLYSLASGSMPLPSQIKTNPLQISVNGHLIDYFEQGDYNMQTHKRDTSSLMQYDRNTGSNTKLADLPENTCDFRISADGQKLTYITGPDPESNLRVRNLATGEDRPLAAGIEGQHRTVQESYAITADSRFVILGYSGKLHKIDLQTGKEQPIPFTAKVSVDLGPFDYNTFRLTPDSVRVKYTRSANASPDGKQLVFTALDRLYTMKFPDGEPHALVDQPVGQYQPVFSPDGKWIAYITWSDTAEGQLWKVPAAGGKPQQLTQAKGFYNRPVWSPDGKQLAVFKRHPISWDMEVQLIPASGGALIKIVDSLPSRNNYLQFSGDGKQVFFKPKESRHPDYEDYPVLSSITLDGKNASILATAPLVGNNTFEQNGISAVSPPAEVSISPDNRYVIYQMHQDLFLSPIPGTGSPVVLNSSTATLPIFRLAIGGVDPHWENNGKTLSWSFGNYFYRVNPDQVVAQAIRLAQESALDKLSAKGIFMRPPVPEQVTEIRVVAPRNYAHGSIALRDVRIISMKGDEVIEHGTIVITDGRFKQVGSASDTPIPPGAKVYDLQGKTVMPGLVDLHDHLSGDAPADVFAQQWWQFLVNLAYGVTTARDPSSNFDSFGYAELLETGQMLGPRLFSVGEAILDYNHLKGLEDARELIRKRALFNAVTVKQYVNETREQRQWVLIASRELGLNMTNEGQDVPAQIAMIKDGSTGVEHNPGWGKVYDDILKLYAESGTWHTPTLHIIYPGGDRSGFHYFVNQFQHAPDDKLKRFWPEDDYKRLMKPLTDTIKPGFLAISQVEARIRHLGGNVTMGSHGNYAGIGSHWETWALQMGGLSIMEALQAATIEGARGLGMQQDLGSIEVGKLADLIILDKNPLQDIHNTLSIKYVMKDGILYDVDTLASLVHQK